MNLFNTNKESILYLQPQSTEVCCYYHVLTNLILPILELIKENIINNKQTICIPSIGKFEWILGLLNFLNIVHIDTRQRPRANTPILFLDSFNTMQMRRPSDPNYLDHYYRPTAIQPERLSSITHYFWQNVKSYYKLYNVATLIIQRDYKSKKFIPNLKNLNWKLHQKQHNSVLLHLENRSLIEQVGLFRQAKLIIAQHGSALANLLWTADCKNKPTVIEIVPPSKENIFYYDDIYRKFDIKHYYIKQENDNAKIDIDEIMNLIENIYMGL